MKTRPLLIGENGFALPIEAVTESIGIIAKRRAGKSTTARRLTEQLYHAKQHVVVVDPKGDWHGLLYARDGKRPGLPFIVLGGEHGHVPLEMNSGEVVARLVVEDRVNVILDLSRFRKNDVPVFMTPFLESLYRLKAQEQYRTAMMLIIDEADAIAPQKPDRTGQALMAAALEDIVRRGGQRGIGCTMITQRASVLSKNVLTQIGILIILRTIAPQDLRAMDDWISAHGTDDERTAVMTALPTMAPGEAYVWAPGWPDGHGIFARVQMLLPETFDSSSTPRAGVKASAPKHAATVDLGALQARMAATIAHAKENDPRELKQALAEARTAQIELQRKYDALSRGHDELFRERERLTKKRGLSATQIRRLMQLTNRAYERTHRRIAADVTKLRGMASTLGTELERHLTRMEKHAAAARSVYEGQQWTPPKVNAQTPTLRQAPAPSRVSIIDRPLVTVDRGFATNGTVTNRAAVDAVPLGEGERKTLVAIVAAETVTREYLTLVTGYKKSTRNAYVQRLAARGYVVVGEQFITATAFGVQVAGPVEHAPTGAALVDWWLGRLPAGEATILKLVLAGVSSRDALSEQSGLKKSTRNAYLQRLATRSLIDVDAADQIRPHAVLRS
jgi:hypothetical protein